VSAKDRAERAAKQRQERFDRMALEGARENMVSPNGRAFMWSILSLCLDAEGDEGAGRRAMARDIQRALRLADFDGLQTMRDEWERPTFGAHAEAESEEADDRE